MSAVSRSGARPAVGGRAPATPWLLTWLLTAWLGLASGAWAAGTDAQPGLVTAVYGRVLPGAEGPPPVLNAQPVQVRATRSAPVAGPVYLYVPGAERRHWPQHCARHQACALPVYFVDGPRWARQLGAPAEAGEIGPAAEAGGAAE